MTLVKFYPGHSKQRNLLTYSDLMNNIFQEPAFTPSFNSPKVNIREEAGNFQLQVALPGVDRNSLSIEVDRDILKISNKNHQEDEKEAYTRREFNFSSFERSFRLPESVDTTGIEAKLENGILNLVLPKKEEAIDKGPREISVS